MVTNANVPLRVQLLDERATLPRYARDGDAGLDLHASAGALVAPYSRVTIQTGIAVEIPRGFVGYVQPRSGLAQRGIEAITGTIDSGYRGPIGVTLHNDTAQPFTVRVGDRVAQLVVQPVAQCSVYEVQALSPSERGTGGFGSTGIGAQPLRLTDAALEAAAAARKVHAVTADGQRIPMKVGADGMLVSAPFPAAGVLTAIEVDGVPVPLAIARAVPADEDECDAPDDAPQLLPRAGHRCTFCGKPPHECFAVHDANDGGAQ